VTARSGLPLNESPPIDASPPPPGRYLRVHELARLQNVLFAPRRPVRGIYAGRHASRQRGHCVEFNDYREYTPGDEVGDIDWKAFGRSDRLYIKLFEHQADMTVNLLVDASASMGYAGLDSSTPSSGRADSWMGKLKTLSGKRRDHQNTTGTPGIINPSKYDQACLMASAIAFLTVRQQDRIGFAAALNGLHQEIKPSGGFAHLNHVLRSMERVKPAGKARLVEALHTLSRHTPRRSLLVLFSDLIEDRDAVMHALSAFTARGGDVIVFQVLHQDELHLPGLSEALFVDSETGQQVRVNVPDIQQAYQERITKTTDGWRDVLTARGIDHQLVSTAAHYHEAIRDYLFTRAAHA
jgi:uncharacterized protein (DUF58 family)